MTHRPFRQIVATCTILRVLRRRWPSDKPTARSLLFELRSSLTRSELASRWYFRDRVRATIAYRFRLVHNVAAVIFHCDTHSKKLADDAEVLDGQAPKLIEESFNSSCIGSGGQQIVHVHTHDDQLLIIDLSVQAYVRLTLGESSV